MWWYSVSIWGFLFVRLFSREKVPPHPTPLSSWEPKPLKPHEYRDLSSSKVPLGFAVWWVHPGGVLSLSAAIQAALTPSVASYFVRVSHLLIYKCSFCFFSLFYFVLVSKSSTVNSEGRPAHSIVIIVTLISVRVLKWHDQTECLKLCVDAKKRTTQQKN